jgi:hypothetical protein
MHIQHPIAACGLASTVAMGSLRVQSLLTQQAQRVLLCDAHLFISSQLLWQQQSYHRALVLYSTCGGLFLCFACLHVPYSTVTLITCHM